MVIAKDNIRKHYDNDPPMAMFDDSKPWGRLKKRELSYVLDFLENRSGTLLDLGCGPGIYSSQLLKRGLSVVSVDFSFNMLQFFKKTVQFPPCPVNADAENLPFRDSSFDFVLCVDVMHHLPDDVVVNSLKQMHAVLKKEGILIFEFKNSCNPLLWWRYRKKSSDEFLLCSRSFATIQKLLQDSGFEIIRTKGIGFPLKLIAPYTVVIAKKVGVR
ncbi:hypothetical protein COT72_03995 [archaeon CG10_big_fil_rev_8_21_14_0_10_43_11]|nr:MAG: hypothetical protein COT72_03995 [archaeon CG10_big_fil_rev_8_21_14_0_10_43_11]